MAPYSVPVPVGAFGPGMPRPSPPYSGAAGASGMPSSASVAPVVPVVPVVPVSGPLVGARFGSLVRSTPVSGSPVAVPPSV